jgi:hypothetical protein
VTHRFVFHLFLAQKGRRIFTFEKEAEGRPSMLVDVAVLSPELPKEAKM